MFQKVRLVDLDHYFLPKSKRASMGIYCCRTVGYDDKLLEFLSHYFYQTKKSGIYIQKQILNPTESQIQYFYKVAGDPFICDQTFIYNVLARWLPRVGSGQLSSLSEALYAQLNKVLSESHNDNIVKNAYIKFMCWLYYKFENLLHHLGEEDLPKVLYEGALGKYELYILSILAHAGCDVLIVNFKEDDAYLKVDQKSEYTSMLAFSHKGEPTCHFTKMDWEQSHKRIQIEEQFEAFSSIILPNSWMTQDFLEDVLKDNSQRGLQRDKIFTLFVQNIGTDKPEEFENILYFWKLKLDNIRKHYLITENRIENPSVGEVNGVKKGQYSNTKELIFSLSEQIKISQDKTLNTLAVRAFVKVMEQQTNINISKLTNMGICLLCWIKRYSKLLFEHYEAAKIPLFIYFGGCNHNEAAFMTMLSFMPVDVILFCPDKTLDFEFSQPALRRIVCRQSLALKEFPKKERNLQVSTVAYKAERDLDTILYQDTGLFRERQFLKSVPVVLRTTYEEIDILWKEEAKYRPSFEAFDQKVMVPTIFAKISGVKDSDLVLYWQSLDSKITENTILIKNLPYRKGTDENPVKPHVTSFYKDNRLLVDKIKAHHSYQYVYLRENVQDYIIDKIQTLIDTKCIDYDQMGLEYAILATLLYLDKQTIQLIQKFDFTKEIPKLIIIGAGEGMCSLEDSIYIAFLSLVGFDILIYSPAGYRAEGKYIKESMFVEHQAGGYMFDLSIPNLKVKTGKSTSRGIFSKLFG